jgi:hypothetical protein
MKLICGRVEKVNYSNVCDMIIMSVKMGGEERRLNKLVRDLGIYMNKNLDVVRVKGMLESRGCCVEKKVLIGDVLRVEDWVVV